MQKEIPVNDQAFISVQFIENPDGSAKKFTLLKSIQQEGILFEERMSCNHKDTLMCEYEYFDEKKAVEFWKHAIKKAMATSTL